MLLLDPFNAERPPETDLGSHQYLSENNLALNRFEFNVALRPQRPSRTIKDGEPWTASVTGVPGEIKRSRDLRGGRWSWTLTFAQKRS